MEEGAGLRGVLLGALPRIKAYPGLAKGPTLLVWTQALAYIVASLAQ